MDLASGPKDARGRTLQEGDEILLHLPGPIYFRVAQIAPVLDPKMPAGMIYVHVGAMIPFLARRGAVNPEFIRVREAKEAGPSPMKLLDVQPAAGGGEEESQ